MSDRFVDTNVFVYAFAASDSKTAPARRILVDGGVVSVQVLNEVVDVLRRKYRFDDGGIADVQAEIEDGFRIVPLTLAAQRAALQLSARARLRIYDAMIVATAAEAGCSRLLTEDLGHGASLLGVTIDNPFRDA